MKKCNTCKVTLYDSEIYCPLCYLPLNKTKKSIVQYPDYNVIISKKKIVNNTSLFVAISSAIICMYINLFTHQKGEVFWSLIVSSSILYTYIEYNLLSKQVFLGEKILFSYIYTSSLLVIIDFVTGMNQWSTEYVFPFITLGVIIILTILAVRGKRFFSEYFGYILSVVGVSLISIIFFLLNLNKNGWSAFIVLITSLILVIGLYVFADKTLKEEIKRRFNRR